MSGVMKREWGGMVGGQGVIAEDERKRGKVVSRGVLRYESRRGRRKDRTVGVRVLGVVQGATSLLLEFC